MRVFEKHLIFQTNYIQCVWATKTETVIYLGDRTANCGKSLRIDERNESKMAVGPRLRGAIRDVTLRTLICIQLEIVHPIISFISSDSLERLRRFRSFLHLSYNAICS